MAEHINRYINYFYSNKKILNGMVIVLIVAIVLVIIAIVKKVLAMAIIGFIIIFLAFANVSYDANKYEVRVESIGDNIIINSYEIGNIL